MKIIVTGGAGYIGSHTIVELLGKGYEVISIDNFSNSKPDVFDNIEKITGKRVENYEVDLCDYKKLEELFKGKKFDAIIHFAAYKAVGESVSDPISYYKNNLGALMGILDIAHLCGVSSFIFSSSAAIYDSNGVPPYSEESSKKPASPYGKTKEIGEIILSDYVSHKINMKVCSLRYFNPGGAHDSLLIGENPNGVPNNLVPIMTKSVKEGKEISIFGDDYDTTDGTCIRDYIHVCDVARAHILALGHLESGNSKNEEVFNIGRGVGVSVLEMIKAFESVNNIKVPYKIAERRAGDVGTLYADTKKAQEILNFKTEYSIDDIMKSAWEWENREN
jgi:UDP-glucose 4-epimerase